MNFGKALEAVKDGKKIFRLDGTAKGCSWFIRKATRTESLATYRLPRLGA